jgi:hypothetical protein
MLEYWVQFVVQDSSISRHLAGLFYYAYLRHSGVRPLVKTWLKKAYK